MAVKSNEVVTTSIDSLIDLLTRPLLKVSRIGLQMATLSWEFDADVDLSLVKSYRIVLNSRPIETLPSNQREHDLLNLKPGIHCN